MANWLLDYIEMTEYIPPEFRNQSFSMRELDLKVSNAMSQLEDDIKEFFNKIDTLASKEKQEHYEALVKKCDEATQVANTKVQIADRLHDLVEKSMRLLDQGLEKLKEDLIEGDKAYIVEDIERRSQELDDQLRLESEIMMQRQQKLRDSETNNHHNHKGSHSVHNNIIAASNHRSSNHHHASSNNHHQHSNHSTQLVTPHNNHQAQIRYRHNSTGTISTTTTTMSAATSGTSVKQRKRERKRLNSAMTIFNRNSKTEDDVTNQAYFLPSPTTPEYLANLHSSNSNTIIDVSGGDTSCLTLKGMIAGGNRNCVNVNDKSNGSSDPPVAKARQPILTAIDAAHAVSPNATNSDKLVLFSSNSNGDNFNSFNNIKDRQIFQNQPGHLSDNIISPGSGLNNSGHNLSGINGSKFIDQDGQHYYNHHIQQHGRSNYGAGSPFSALSRHDPIMLAASQAIHATQNTTPGRRTSSLKASYAAVNSGRLQHPNANHSIFDQTNMNGEVYCKCRGTIHDPNMIACDNRKCKYEWFHYECVGITAAPPGEWYCDDCRDLPRTAQEQAANSSKHQQSRQAANNLLQTTDYFKPKSEANS